MGLENVRNLQDGQLGTLRRDTSSQEVFTAVKTSPDTSPTSGITTAPTPYNITLTVADTQYSQLLPAGTKKIAFQNRNNNTLRFAFLTGKVAVPTGDYFTVKPGQNFTEIDLNLQAVTLYFASDNAGDVVELVAWT